MTWMRRGLTKANWWSVGYPPAHANLITIQTKAKGQYLNLLTNWATLKQVTARKRERSFPAITYLLPASSIQVEYNKFKCKVDEWNKALLEYYRRGYFVSEEVTYSQFFMHAWTLQSHTYYLASTGSTISQLEFRKRLIQELLVFAKLEQPEQPLGQKQIHWPTKNFQSSGKCQFPPCRNNCTFWCAVCNRRGCLPCLERAHLG